LKSRSIVRGYQLVFANWTETETNQSLRSKLSYALSSTLENIGVANKALIFSIDRKFTIFNLPYQSAWHQIFLFGDNFLLVSGSLKLDHGAFTNIGSILTPCHGEMRELKRWHHSKVVEITKNARKCLEEEYLLKSNS
jgi:kinesin family member 11